MTRVKREDGSVVIKQRRSRRKTGIIVGTLGVLTTLATIQYGPELLGYHRFDQSLNRIVAKDIADAGAFPRLPDVCVVCHGFNGDAVNTAYPKLAGQPVSYLIAQLQAFADGQRTNPSMAPMALALTGAEVRRLADYFSRQQPIEIPWAPPDAAQRERAVTLIKRLNCAACHGTSLEGHDQFPRLSAQNAGYLAQQLEAYRERDRQDPSGAMNLVVDSLTSQDIIDVAQYLSNFERSSADRSR